MVAISVAVWSGLILLVVLGSICGIRFLRLGRKPKGMASVPRPAAPAKAPAPVPAKPAESGPRIPVTASKPKILEPLPPAQITLPTSAALPLPPRKVAALPTPKKTNGKPLRLLNGHASRRRKIFDYNRYFADLMSTVSGHTGALEGAGALALPNAAPQVVNSGAIQPSNAAFQANSELIASQTAFIEEQRRLIQEQTRVIEEKTRLIAEKNQLLKMQTEMIESKLL